MAQEKMDDFMQYAKDLAKAERELSIEHCVYITFEIRHEDGSREVLHIIDILREMLDRWRWVIEWRKAKLICKYPKERVQVYHCFYDKRSGLQTGMNFILSKVASAKAQITKVERTIAEYINCKKHNDLFFNIDTDEQLLKAYNKLEQKKENYQKIYAMLQEEVKKHKENSDKYKLFIGFNKLGEFGSISEAKKHANDSGLSGVFNLIGDRYQDSWYISSQDIRKV